MSSVSTLYFLLGSVGNNWNTLCFTVPFVFVAEGSVLVSSGVKFSCISGAIPLVFPAYVLGLIFGSGDKNSNTFPVLPLEIINLVSSEG
jgi:hypothetical protein